MAHHKRTGGRILELMLMVVVLTLTIALIAAGFFATIVLLVYFDIEGSKAGNLAFVGAIFGGYLSSKIWKPFLNYYRYTSDLKPIKEPDQEAE